MKNVKEHKLVGNHCPCHCIINCLFWILAQVIQWPTALSGILSSYSELIDYLQIFSLQCPVHSI